MFNQKGEADPVLVIFMIIGFIIGGFIGHKLYHLADKIDKKQAEVIKEEPTSVELLAEANGFKASKRVVAAIEQASKTYGIAADELAAIAIVETGLGRDVKTRVNKNGTTDHGLFQINSVNYNKCLEYNLDTPEGSSLCAAKLLSILKEKRKDYLGAYHSKTPSKKLVYLEKLNEVLDVASR